MQNIEIAIHSISMSKSRNGNVTITPLRMSKTNTAIPYFGPTCLQIFAVPGLPVPSFRISIPFALHTKSPTNADPRR